MIKRGFIKKQLQKSKNSKRTSQFLRRFTLLVVDKALRQRYGENYPTKCLQSSVGIRTVLDSMGIAATLFTGAVCFAEVFKEDDSVVSWSGFWDKDHHVWAVTEFGELVDLTVSELHLHPSSKRKDAVPVPAVWWEDLESWPRVIRYLPEGPISIALPGDETIDLDEFKANVLDVMNRVLNELTVNEIIFHPIMESGNSINLLTKEGNLWLSKSLKVQDLSIPFPEWIQRRENELRQQFSERSKNNGARHT